MGIATVQGVGANQSDPPSTTPDLAVADKAGADKAGPTKQKETLPQPFLVGEGLPTSSPSKLVARIWKGMFCGHGGAAQG